MNLSEIRYTIFRIMLYFGSLNAIKVEAAGTFSSCGNNAGSNSAA